MTLDGALELAMQLVDQHGLTRHGWRVEFDRAKRRFGSCRWTKKLITLSGPLTELNDVGEVRQTILHEIAHALAGRTAGHGSVWKRVAERLGCRPERCYGAAVRRPPAPYIVECARGCFRAEAMRRKRLFCKKCWRQAKRSGEEVSRAAALDRFEVQWRANPAMGVAA